MALKKVGTSASFQIISDRPFLSFPHLLTHPWLERVLSTRAGLPYARHMPSIWETMSILAQSATHLPSIFKVFVSSLPTWQRDHGDDTVGTPIFNSMYANKSLQSSICNSRHEKTVWSFTSHHVPCHPLANTKPHTMNLLSMKCQSHIDMMSAHSYSNNNPRKLMQIVPPFIQEKKINPLYI